MSNIIIATLYGIEPVMLSATKLAADKLILILSKKPDEKQEKSLDLLKKTLGSVVSIKTVKVDQYDIVEIAQEVVKIIDLLDEKDVIYANVTSGRKTMSLGLLYASYCRVRRVKKIIYITEEDHKIISLPKLSYNLTQSQQRLMDYIIHGKYQSLAELAKEVDISRGMLYRNIRELQNLGLIEEDDGLKLTDAGKIAMM